MEYGECCYSVYDEREMGQCVISIPFIFASTFGHEFWGIAGRVAIPDRSLLVLDATLCLVHNCYLLF